MCYWQGRDTEDAGESEQPAGFQMLKFGVPHLSDCDLCSWLPLTITTLSVPDHLLGQISSNYLFMVMTCT